MAGEDAVTPAELEAALEALREPGRFDAAERLVGLAAPGLHRILVEAMAGGGWNSEDDAREIDKALASSDPAKAKAEVLGLLGEGSRVAMLVGVAVGIELAAELDLHGQGPAPASGPPLTVTRHSGNEGSA